MISVAYAMGQSGSAGQSMGGFSAFVPVIIMFVIFYFLIIRPQQKKTKEHQVMINNLKKGDSIITSCGIHGRVTALDETIITVEIADKVRVKINRPNVAMLKQSAQPLKTEK